MPGDSQESTSPSLSATDAVDSAHLETQSSFLSRFAVGVVDLNAAKMKTKQPVSTFRPASSLVSVDS